VGGEKVWSWRRAGRVGRGGGRGGGGGGESREGGEGNSAHEKNRGGRPEEAKKTKPRRPNSDIVPPKKQAEGEAGKKGGDTRSKHSIVAKEKKKREGLVLGKRGQERTKTKPGPRPTRGGLGDAGVTGSTPHNGGAHIGMLSVWCCRD